MPNHRQKSPRKSEHALRLQDWEVRAAIASPLVSFCRPMTPQPSDFKDSIRHVPKHASAYFDAYCGRLKTVENPRGMSERWCWWTSDDRQGDDWIRCPFGIPGDHLWVQECWAVSACAASESYIRWEHKGYPIWYRADSSVRFTLARDGGPAFMNPGNWVSSSRMVPWASRLRLQVVSIRCLRLHDVTVEDALAMGLTGTDPLPDGDVNIYTRTGRGSTPCPRAHFRHRWIQHYGRTSWDANPWVWFMTTTRDRLVPTEPFSYT